MWTADMDCSVCHVKEAESLVTSTTLCSKHSTLACGDCHADSNALELVHKDSSPDAVDKAKLKETTVEKSLCLGCHDEAELVAAASDVTVLTDLQGTVVNPHDLPANEDHEKSISCVDCHEFHVADYDVAKTAPEECISCHHDNIYECHTCHD